MHPYTHKHAQTCIYIPVGQTIPTRPNTKTIEVQKTQYAYIYIYICMYVCMYVCIHTGTEKYTVM